MRSTVWNPPSVGLIKFNVDGSARGAPGISGIGGALRSDNWTILGKFSKAMGILWAFQAEVQAILHALLFCREFQLKDVIIESDSSLAVGWVERKQNRPWKLLGELNLIDRYMLEVNCVGVLHIFWEANSDADELAKSGCDRDTPIWCIL